MVPFCGEWSAASLSPFTYVKASTHTYRGLLHGEDICLFCCVVTASTQAEVCRTAKTFFFFGVSLVMVEKLKVSLLSMLYDLNHSLSPGLDDQVLSTILLEHDGHGFIQYTNNGGWKGICDAYLRP